MKAWLIGVIVPLGLTAVIGNAQWATYHDPTIPRTKDGKPNLTAPVPRLGGKPDLSGIWQPESSPLSEIKSFLLPEGINGLGEDLPTKYFFNFFSDFPAGQEPFQPTAAEAYKKRGQTQERPASLCTLPSMPLQATIPSPFKIVQNPRVMLFLYENETVFRQVFTDGRKLPADPQPSWLGYSVGRWDGNTFLTETVGFNDQGPLDMFGHPRSESSRLTEKFHRRDFGHADLDITLDDPKNYVKPVSIHVPLRLLPDTELIETFCAEDEKDLVHFK